MIYDIEACAIELDVQELCAFATRRGDLDQRVSVNVGHPDDKQLYYKLQSEAGAYYNPDVELFNTVKLGELYYTVSLKADGVIRKNGKILVDKIKCVKGRGGYAPPDEMTVALLKCSAYFVAVRDALESIEGRISYYNCDTKKLRYFKYVFSTKELKDFYLELLGKIRYRAEIVAARQRDELPAAKVARFPYGELREGQETMIRESHSAIKRGKRIFIEAPTGTGKTISALFPAIRALGEGYCDKIFYLTPKVSTRREAFSAAAKLHSCGVMQRTVMLSAKEQTCLCQTYGAGEKNTCSAQLCPYARGYYDRVDGALKEMLEGYRGYSRSLILEMAKKYQICPHELSLDLSELCDVIICDYNYVFDPHVYLRRYFGAEGRGRNEKYVFLIDEAHNLADRARDAYSAQLRLSSFVRIRNSVFPDDPAASGVEAMLDPVIVAIGRIKKLCRDELIKDENGNERGFYIASEAPEKITASLTDFKKRCGEWLKKNKDHPLFDMLDQLWSSVRKYITVNEYFDGSFKFYAEIEGGDISIKLYCLDPSDIMDSLLTRARASVMFSATLTPPEYFCDVLGGGNSAEKLTLCSPFPKENLCVAVADYVNTRFDTRDSNAKRFATVIAATVAPKHGNYIAYFPSYQCLEQTWSEFTRKYPRVQTVVQKKNMTVAQREGFLAEFKQDTGHLRVGFCVLGGMFSEGVDLPGSRLIGSIIFGVGLPGLSNEKNIIKEHFDIKSDEGIGYDYAYTFPGMNNVLQAAGRVIRTAEDCGVVVLADDRYATPKYRTLFPEHWNGIKYAGNASSLAEIIRRFWEKQE